MTFLRTHGIAVMLLFAPVAAGLHYLAPQQETLIFGASSLAVLPLAAYIGRATESLAERFGGGIGGLLNATFGNAAELIIGGLALRNGLTDLVKASITGSIIGNVLLVFGASAVVGGIPRGVQRFNRTAASAGTTMLLLSAIGLLVPAVFHWLSRNTPDTPELQLDTEIAVVLCTTYALSLLFTLKTHRQLYATSPPERPGRARSRGGLRFTLAMLAASTAGVAYMSELLVETVSSTARHLGMSELFVGVVIVALIGNAAEHYSAVVLAAHDDMDAALGIAVGSSTQIALFVAPVLVFLSYVIAPHPMDLLFTEFEVVAIITAVLAIAFISHDGETHWFEGVQLLAIYAILVLAFFFLPGRAATR